MNKEHVGVGLTPHVLMGEGEIQPPAGLQNTGNLAQGGIQIGDMLEHLIRCYHVKATIGKGQDAPIIAEDAASQKAALLQNISDIGTATCREILHP